MLHNGWWFRPKQRVAPPRGLTSLPLAINLPALTFPYLQPVVKSHWRLRWEEDGGVWVRHSPGATTKRATGNPPSFPVPPTSFKLGGHLETEKHVNRCLQMCGDSKVAIKSENSGWSDQCSTIYSNKTIDNAPMTIVQLYFIFIRSVRGGLTGPWRASPEERRLLDPSSR